MSNTLTETISLLGILPEDDISLVNTMVKS